MSMFRKLSRKNKQLSTDECIEILKTERRGVLSVIGDDDYPYGMPMNHYYNDEDGCVYFHCGMGGHRFDSINRCNKVSYCVYDKGHKSDNFWAYKVKSVIIFGTIEVIDDINTVVDISRKLSYKFTKDLQYIESEIEKYAKKTLLLKVQVQHMCGKQVLEA